MAAGDDAAGEAAGARTTRLLSDLVRSGRVLDVKAAAAAAAKGARHGAATAPVLRRGDTQVAATAAASAAGVAAAMLVTARSSPRDEHVACEVVTEMTAAAASAGAAAGVFVFAKYSDWVPDHAPSDVADEVLIASAAAAAAVDARAGAIAQTPQVSSSVFRPFLLVFSIGVAILAAFIVIYMVV